MSLPENKSNSVAFAERFVLSTSGLVAHHSQKFQWNAGPQKRRYSRWNSLITCLRAQRHAIEVERSPSWIFLLPVWSHSILTSPNGMLDPENMGIAVEILLISCLEAEIHVIKVCRPPSWIFPLPVWSQSSYVPMES